MSGGLDACLRAARHAAHRLGLFGAAAVPRSVEELAAELGCGAQRLARLVDVLVAEASLRRDAEGRVAAAAVPPVEPVVGSRLIWEILRRDQPYDPRLDAVSLRVDAAALGIPCLLSDNSGAPTLELAARLSARLAGGGKLLDLGCGYGDLTDAVLARAPLAHAAAVDFPGILQVAAARLVPYAGRVTFWYGDLEAVTVAPPGDVAVLANVLHFNTAQRCAAIVKRAAAGLREDGELWIKEVAMAEDRSGPLVALVFALAVALFTPVVDMHTPASLRTWLAEAGLAHVEEQPLQSAPEAIVLCARRG